MLKHVLAWSCMSIVLIIILGMVLTSQSDRSSTLLRSDEARLIFSEDFDHPQALERFQVAQPDLGFEAGTQERPAWRIEDGRLIAHQAHNATLWLTKALPSGDVRVTFTARALTKEGDVKCEFAGDGHHHQSGYILINGGWKNTVRAIARQDEHGEDRHEDRRCGKRRQCVPHNKDVEWVIERRDQVLMWYLDGRLVLRYRDAHPLLGQHFGFNNWSAEVQFDDLRVYQLSTI